MSREHTVFLSTKIFKGPRLLKFSIHKPTSSSLKLFRILTSHPVTLLKQKRVLSKEKHCLLRTNSVKENFDKHKRDLQQRLRGYPVTFMNKIHTTEQRPFVTKQRRRKKFYRFLPCITRPHQIFKRFSWNTGTSFNRSLDLHISFNQPPIVSYRKEKSIMPQS